ncbi:hypothetical protein P6O23_05275 [Clostridium perfringens]|nr:hypothetical protein [Clostridium perfringens]
MNNSIFMIKANDNEETATLILQKLKSALDCSKENKIIDERFFIYAILSQEIKVEVIRKCDEIWIINLIGYDDKKKRKLINMLNNDDIFKKLIFIFETKSNELVSENYKILHDFEVKLRSQFCFDLLDNWGNEIFDILDKINVKEESRINENIISSKFNTKLQRIDLLKLIEYMKENVWGGGEIEKLNAFKDGIVDDNIKRILDLEIFKNTLNIIDDEKRLIRTRNNICHNRMIHSNVFENELKVLKSINEKINKLYCKSARQYLNIKQDTYLKEINNEIILLIEERCFDNNEKNIKLLFSKILNMCGYIFNNESEQLELIKFNGCTENYLIKQTPEEGINFTLRYIVNNDKKSNVFLLRITFDNKQVSINSIAKLRDEIFKNIDKKFILLNDTISLNYSNNLFVKFNYIENLLRAYIATFYTLNEIDLKGIEAKNNSKNNETLVESNNPLFDLDFIDLSDILSNTPKGYKNKEIINEFKKCIDDKENFEKLKKKLRNISDTNSDIIEIINAWDELYKYRTIVMHNEYISKYEYEYILELVENIIEIIEKIYFDIINKSMDNEYIIFEDKSRKVYMKIRKTDAIIKIKDKIYEFENIGINKFYKLIRYTVGKNVFEIPFILSEISITDYFNSEKDKIYALIDKNEFIPNINEAIKNLKYTKYLKTRTITSREELLEEKIGELLKSLEGKINDINDELCATLI